MGVRRRRLTVEVALVAVLSGVLAALVSHAVAWQAGGRGAAGPVVVAAPHLVTRPVVIDGLTVRTAAYQLRVPSDPFWMWKGLSDKYDDLPQGADRVPLFPYGGRVYRHPIVTQIFGLSALSSGDMIDAKAAGANLLAHADHADGALWFPYVFDYQLYGDPAKTLRAPWFSALAQGQALSLFVGLYRGTHDARWLRAADDTFRSFTTNTHDIVQRDADGYLWLEEYPHPGTGGEEVFNGDVTAATGLVDYWSLTGRGSLLAQAAITTAEHYAAVIRNPRTLSSYSIRNQADKSPDYHQLHITQLHGLAAVTGDPYFERMARAFAADA